MQKLLLSYQSPDVQVISIGGGGILMTSGQDVTTLHFGLNPGEVLDPVTIDGGDF